MALGDGSAWNEAVPTNSTVANQIDDYNRDLRVGISGRMRMEHVWPASQTSTAEAGYHNYITMQAQTAAPAMAGTTAGAVWVKSSGLDVWFTDSGGTDRQICLLSTAAQTFSGVVSVATSTDGANGIMPKSYIDTRHKVALIQSTASGAINTNSATYVEMDSMTGSASGAGSYLLMFCGSVYGPNNTAFGRATFYVDSTTNSEHIIPSHTSPQNFGMQESITLGAGDHTFAVRWKRDSGDSVNSTAGRILTIQQVATT